MLTLGVDIADPSHADHGIADPHRQIDDIEVRHIRLVIDPHLTPVDVPVINRPKLHIASSIRVDLLICPLPDA
jgi:hypothetical protein